MGEALFGGGQLLGTRSVLLPCSHCLRGFLGKLLACRLDCAPMGHLFGLQTFHFTDKPGNFGTGLRGIDRIPQTGRLRNQLTQSTQLLAQCFQAFWPHQTIEQRSQPVAFSIQLGATFKLLLRLSDIGYPGIGQCARQGLARGIEFVTQLGRVGPRDDSSDCHTGRGDLDGVRGGAGPPVPRRDPQLLTVDGDVHIDECPELDLRRRGLQRRFRHAHRTRRRLDCPQALRGDDQ
ncbi:Uncharacterised protein [Mycobacteroides abscessus subsp. abscessus]|nr:Uncharacterised protein [Mycobacteroides abscessus subsp. abscessus]